MQRNVEDVPAWSAKPGCHAAQLIVLLEQQHPMPATGECIRGGQPCQTTADNDAVILVTSAFEEVFGHDRTEMKSRLACEMAGGTWRRVRRLVQAWSAAPRRAANSD